jgi:hypothetical protein
MGAYVSTTIATSSVNFQPLSLLLQSIPSEKLDAARSLVAGFDRDSLISRCREAFAAGKRLATFIMADELTKRGIPRACQYFCVERS